jgi:uncharacterized protein YggU (UPF0235/DUF167 family)
MKLNNEQFKNMQGGSAITLVCIRSETKAGWGKKNKNGTVEIYIPYKANEIQRDQIVINELTNLLSIKHNQIELIAGKKDYLIVTIIDVLSDQVNNAFEKVLKK